MINLKSVILNLEEKEYNAFNKILAESKADKYCKLFTLYRENKLEDYEISDELNVNSNAFYVLKSRLYDKLREFLIEELTAPRLELLKQIATIPSLLFDVQKDTSIAILTKLEKDLLMRDMPYELTGVYSALKKLSLYSDKHYEYTQQYNKHVAYTLALDKAEDLLFDFTRKLGDYYISKDDTLLEIMPVLKQEIANVCGLYKSHHLKVYKNIIDVSFALFLPLPDAVKDDEPVEDILKETQEIITAYPKDTNYKYLNNVLNFLAFEYYHKFKLYKKEAQYFDFVNEQLPHFLFYNHTCLCSKFLISKLERYIYLEKEAQLFDENIQIFNKYNPEKSDVPNYVNYIKYMAASAYYSGDYKNAIKLLNDLLNTVSLKNYTHAEVEIKLLLVLCYSMVNKYDQAWTLSRSISRKVKELNRDMSYENAAIFIKMLKQQMGSKKGSVKAKLTQLKNQFELLNQGSQKMLEYIKLDDDFIAKLAMPIK